MSAILIISLIALLVFAFALGKYLLPDVSRLMFQYGSQLIIRNNKCVRYYAEFALCLFVTIVIATGAVLCKGAASTFVAWLTSSDIVEFTTALRGTYSFTSSAQHPGNHIAMLFVAPLLKLFTAVVLLEAVNAFMSGVNKYYRDMFDSSDEFFYSAIAVVFVVTVEILWHAQNVHLLNLGMNIAYVMLDKLAYVVFFLSLYWIKLSTYSKRNLRSAADKYLEVSEIEEVLMNKPVLMIAMSYIVSLLMSMPNFLGLQWIRNNILLLVLFIVVAALTLLLVKLLFSGAWNYMAAILFNVSHRNCLMKNFNFEMNGRAKKIALTVIAVLLVAFLILYFKPMFMFLLLGLMFSLLIVTVMLLVYFISRVLTGIVRAVLGEKVNRSGSNSEMVSVYLNVVTSSLAKSMRYVALFCLACFMLITVFPKHLSEFEMNRSVVDTKGAVLYIDQRSDYYVPVHVDEIPEFFKTLLVSQEDKYFFAQNSTMPNRSNWHGLSLAFLKGRGGSNINCQLVKNYTYLSAPGFPMDLSRKACDMLGAYMLSLTLTPDEILEKYVNVASFHGARGFRGLNAASLFAFGKPVGQLSEIQQLYLVRTLPRSTNIQDLSIGTFPYAKVHEDEIGIVKQILVKKAESLFNSGIISRREFNSLKHDTLGFTNCRYISPVSVGTRLLLADRVKSGRGDTYITLENEHAINRAFDRLRADGRYRKNGSELQVATVVVNVKTGHMLGHFSTGALDYSKYRNGFPIGSLGKPAIILEMLALGASPNMTLYDGQIGSRKTPKNAEKEWSNSYVNITEILSRSLNAPFANIREIMNARTVFVNTEHSYSQIGINSDEEDASLCNDTYNYPLGNRLMTVMEMAELYQTIMNDGVHIPLSVMLTDSVVVSQRIYDARNVSVVKSALKETVQTGTMSSYLNRLPSNRVYYAKTGTSSRQKDGWCVLSDGDLLIVTWCSYGRQNGEQLALGTESLYGSSTAGLFSVLIYQELHKCN